MTAAIEERISDSAIWCLRLAVFLVPYFVLVVLFFRFGKIEPVQLFALVGVGLIIALVALTLSVRAFGDLWFKGYRGGSRVVRGTLISLLILMPFLYYAFLAVQLPLANDMATNPYDPPAFSAAIAYRSQRASKGMNQILDYTPQYAAEIVRAYPQLQSRRYPASPERVLEAVTAIIQENEWPITATRGVPQTEPQVQESEETNAESETELEDNVPASEDIYVEFVERTILFGFENDLVVRIVSEDQNTLVDVRSASRWGKHDFGYNAKLINDFLELLDASLLGIAGEG